MCRYTVSSTNGVGVAKRSSVSLPVPVFCSSTQYLTTNLATPLWACLSCPLGGYCNGNNASEILPLYGYWLGGFDSTGLPLFVRCDVESACPGVDASMGFWRGSAAISNVTLSSGSLPSFALISAAYRSGGASTCAAEYTGFVCQNCREGFSKSRSGICGRCRTGGLVWAVLIAGLIGIVLVCGGIVYFTLKSRGEPGRCVRR